MQDDRALNTLAKVLHTMQLKRYCAAAAMLLTGFDWHMTTEPSTTWQRLWFEIDHMEPRESAPAFVPNKLEASRILPIELKSRRQVYSWR